MLVRLTAAPVADDPADALLACHARIRSFVELARRAARAADRRPAERLDAAARVRRYFTEALPLHVADEDATVLPRLAGRSPALDAALDRMRREHRGHEVALAELVARCEALTTAGVDGRLAAAADALGEELDAHLAAEEAVIIPAIRALDAAERAAMLAEFAARRGR